MVVATITARVRLVAILYPLCSWIQAATAKKINNETCKIAPPPELRRPKMRRPNQTDSDTCTMPWAKCDEERAGKIVQIYFAESR